MLHSNSTPFVATADGAYRPRLSRETRRLLLTALLALVTLLILARLRFPERPATPNPVQPLLTQLAPPPRFSDLASTIGTLRAQIDQLVTAIAPGGAGDSVTSDRIPALRIDDNLAVTVIDPGIAHAGRALPGLIALDRASGLALVHVNDEGPTAIPLLWNPQRLDEPRYVMVAAPAPDDVWLQPLFLGRLTAVSTPRWQQPVWRVTTSAGLAVGAVVFTEDAELLGMVVAHGAGRAIVPAGELLRAVDVLRSAPAAGIVDTGIEVQSLTPALATAAGTDRGVVVSWVARDRVAAGDLRPGDVIVAIDGVTIGSVVEWAVAVARHAAAEAFTVRVVRAGDERDVQVAPQTPSATGDVPLGLTMRAVSGVGAEIVQVQPGSAADAAALRAGDLVTAIAAVDAPTPARVRSVFAAARRGDILVVAVTRGGSHHVTALER